jgi:hypothetical protein
MSQISIPEKDVQSTLQTRGVNYGDFSLGTQLRANILDLIHENYKIHNNKEMDTFYYLAIHDIVNKLTRISVTPDHQDSWHDIQGYAKLVENHIKNYKYN